MMVWVSLDKDGMGEFGKRWYGWVGIKMVWVSWDKDGMGELWNDGMGELW